MNLLHAIGYRKLALDGINDGNFNGILDLVTGAGCGPHVKVFSYPNLDLLFSFYSGEMTNPDGVFVG